MPLQDALILLLAAVAVVPLVQRLRWSPVLGYLVAGAAIGPFGLAFIKGSATVAGLAELGVVFLLFAVGLELSLERLKVMRRLMLGLGSLQVVVTGGLIGAAVWWLGLGLIPAIIIGGGLAFSSTAFVLQLLVERHEQATRYGRVAFAILLLQDLAFVPMIALVPSFAVAGAAVTTAIALAAAKAVVALVVVFTVGKIVIRPAYRTIAATKNADLFVATTLLIVLGTGWALQQGGVSMALGAFLAGLLLAESEYRHQIEADIRPFRGILLGLFFMSAGMAIDPLVVMRHGFAVMAGLVALMVGKAVVIGVLGRATGLAWPVAVRAGLTLAQGGEFAFVLFAAAEAARLLSADTGQVLYAIVALSMLATPAAAFAGRALSEYLTRRAAADPARISAAEQELAGHVVIAGFGWVGQTVAKVISGCGIPYLALDLNHGRVARLRARGVPIYYGDASQIGVLRAAGIERARAAVITMDQPAAASRAVGALRTAAPDLAILVRARDTRHGRELGRGGATAVVPETVEASLQLGGHLLAAVGTSQDDITRVIDALRRQDYAALDEPDSGQSAVED
ncbi:MAG: potassium transporter KefB [Alphaproteobacteria bacterium]|nr:potassium transporter KefB [Alphaproteobacteria bacterium]